MIMVRVRFAPSPTGFLHIGGVRTALYNELFSLRHGGVFVLRIEDTDRTRYVEGGVENILRSLSACGIVPQEGPYLKADGEIAERGGFGPYIQSQRLDIYASHVAKLVENGNAYFCFCTSERLEEIRGQQMAAGRPVMYDKHCRTLAPEDVTTRKNSGEPSVVRLKVPATGTTSFRDAIRGEVTFANDTIDDQVLLKSDGFPTYHLANVVDDHLMEITHVIRGEEWLPSTPKHILLYDAFGWTPPQFAHLPLLLNPDRSKLSKRQGDVAAEDYLGKGYLPEALVNFVALLGWNPTGDREVYTKEELVEAFVLEKVNKAGAVFDLKKLEWLNREYIKASAPEELSGRAEVFFAKAALPLGGLDQNVLRRVVQLEQPRITTLAELPDAVSYAFIRPKQDTAQLPWKTSTPQEAAVRLEGMKDWLAAQSANAIDDVKGLEASARALIKERGWGNGDTLWPLRVALTGREASPSPFEVIWMLGKEESLVRVQEAINALK